jgi:integrase/recombinase XerD
MQKSHIRVSLFQGGVIPMTTRRRRLIEDVISTGTSELCERAREFLHWLGVKNYRPKSIARSQTCLNYFILWGQARGLSQVCQLSSDSLSQYERYLLHATDPKGTGFSARRRWTYLAALTKFGWWLMYSQILPDNPAAKLVYPKVSKGLPKHLYSHEEIEEIISQADVTSVLGLRDRAMLETLYSTGIRRAELSDLTMADLDLANGLVHIRCGKGGKSRLIPIGDRASQWLSSYLTQVRPRLCGRKRPTNVFVGKRATNLGAESVGKIVHGYVRRAGKTGACHVFRHAMATQMLEHGANLRYIQQMLGHENITTTQVYTHTSIAALQQVYNQTHPASGHCPAATASTPAELRQCGAPHAIGPRSKEVEAHNELSRAVEAYLLHLRLANYSQRTIIDRSYRLRYWLRWCEERSLERLESLSAQLLERYHAHLAAQKHEERPLSPSYIQQHLLTLRYWCAYLADERLIPINIAQRLELPRAPQHIPCQLLTPEEIGRIFAQPDITTPLGLRDRAILETLYATGIRRQELVELAVSDIDFAQARIRITKGKGNTERIVPISQSALSWISQYLDRVRPCLVSNPESPALFLGQFGLPICTKGLARKFKEYMRAAGITKPGQFHIFRHTMASDMLNAGADLRYVQQMLGHESLKSTQIYTRVAIAKLKEVHAQTHPAKPKRPNQTSDS